MSFSLYINKLITLWVKTHPPLNVIYRKQCPDCITDSLPSWLMEAFIGALLQCWSKGSQYSFCLDTNLESSSSYHPPFLEEEWKTQICSCLIKQWQFVHKVQQPPTRCRWMCSDIQVGILKSEHYDTQNTQSFKETSQDLNILGSLSIQCVCFQFKSHFNDIGECRILLWVHYHSFV